MLWRLLLILLAGLAVGLGVALYLDRVPARWNPWALPDPHSAPGPFVGMQLAALARDPERCFAWLAEAGVPATPVPDRVTGPGCGFHGAGRTARGALLALEPPVTATCPLLASLSLWERWTVQPAALELLGVEAAGLVTYGTYACRNVRTDRGEGRNRSQHATANAIDIAGITLADGRSLSIARDWTRTGPDGSPTAEARFLHRLRDGACGPFRAVLSPDHNRAHADHLHLDLGRWRACR